MAFATVYGHFFSKKNIELSTVSTGHTEKILIIHNDLSGYPHETQIIHNIQSFILKLFTGLSTTHLGLSVAAKENVT